MEFVQLADNPVQTFVLVPGFYTAEKIMSILHCNICKLHENTAYS